MSSTTLVFMTFSFEIIYYPKKSIWIPKTTNTITNMMDPRRQDKKLAMAGSATDIADPPRQTKNWQLHLPLWFSHRQMEPTTPPAQEVRNSPRARGRCLPYPLGQSGKGEKSPQAADQGLLLPPLNVASPLIPPPHQRRRSEPRITPPHLHRWPESAHPTTTSTPEVGAAHPWLPPLVDLRGSAQGAFSKVQHIRPDLK